MGFCVRDQQWVVVTKDPRRNGQRLMKATSPGLTWLGSSSHLHGTASVLHRWRRRVSGPHPPLLAGDLWWVAPLDPRNQRMEKRMFVAIARFPKVSGRLEEEFQAWFAWSKRPAS